MGTYDEVEGDLIAQAKEGHYDVIVHGCNCFSTMGAGIAPQMAKAFGADKFEMELRGKDIRKLGNIDYEKIVLGKNATWRLSEYKNNDNDPELIVVNAYTQYSYGRNHIDGVSSPLDYEALTLCMRKMNLLFKGKHIGLPQIGCGLAGGNWEVVKEIIKKELKDCHVTIVIYKP
jgi:O-acetyl-ADP-ribose deacetylase (regulator of RNase III)